MRLAFDATHGQAAAGDVRDFTPAKFHTSNFTLAQ
jgi:hypothetical protein